MSKVEDQRLAILTLDFGPGDFGPTPGTGHVVSPRKRRRNWPHPDLSHPPKRTGEGDRLEVDWGLGFLGLRCAPTEVAAVALRWGWSRAGRDTNALGLRNGRGAPVPPEPTGQELSGGDLAPSGDDKRIPGGDGDPFSLSGEKIPGSRRRADCGQSKSGPDTFRAGPAGRDTLFHREKPGESGRHPSEADGRGRKVGRDSNGNGSRFVGCRQGRLAAAGTPFLPGRSREGVHWGWWAGAPPGGTGPTPGIGTGGTGLVVSPRNARRNRPSPRPLYVEKRSICAFDGDSCGKACEA
jgi:hypothetical protein